MQSFILPIIIAFIIGSIIIASSYIVINFPRASTQLPTNFSEPKKSPFEGIFKPVCGNDKCESEENQNNCCQDCGCPSSYTCQNNICVELKPNIQMSFVQTTPINSVTYLRAKGVGVGKISLSNSGNDVANNVKVIITSPNSYFGEKVINVGSLSQGQSTEISTDLNFFDSVLNIVTDSKLQLDVKTEFYNSVNKKSESVDSFQMNVEGRNKFYWSNPSMVAMWVTPNQPSIKQFANRATGGLATYRSTEEQMLAARWLFETMKAYGAQYATDLVDVDYVQFPIETLTRKGGDCEDSSLLYASLLEAVGIKSVIILIPGHAFSGFINKEAKLVPIETTVTDFDSALQSGSFQYNQHQSDRDLIIPQEMWVEYPQVVLPETTQISMPYITKQIGSCGVSWSWDRGFVGSIPVKFTNSGNAPGAGCAAAITYDANGNKIGEDLSCWVVNSGEIKDVTYYPDISFSNWLEGYYCYAM